MKYLLDANTFMTAARTFYSFDYGTKFWDFLETQAKNNTLASIDKVLKEINKGNDLLKNWANTKFIDYFFPTENEKVLLQYAELMRWAINRSNHYTRNAIDEFMKEDNADPWLIAYACTDIQNYIVVTFETPNPDRKNKIQIPELCTHFQVKYCDLYQMLKKLNFKF